MFLKIVMNMMIILIYLKIVETVPDIPNQGLTHLNLITLIEINHFVESPYQIIDRQSNENIQKHMNKKLVK